MKRQCNNLESVEAKIKKTITLFFVLVSLISADYALFYYVIGFNLAMIFELLIVFISLSWFVMIYKYSYEEIKLTAKLYFYITAKHYCPNK
jgi:hypothetical protein